MRATGLAFEVARPDIDETPHMGESPDAYVARLSREKALAIVVDAARGPAVVLSADTTVVQDGAIIGKPADATEAIAMLQSLRGQPHLVHTGVSVRDTATGTLMTRVITTQVVMRSYADSEIAAYVASGEPFDKAGGYAIQDRAFRPVTALNGCHTNVVGLPMCAACDLLMQTGLRLTPPTCSPDHPPCVVDLPD